MPETITQPRRDKGPGIMTTTIDVPKELWYEFRSRAVRSGSNAKICLVEAIKDWLQKNNTN